MSDAGRGSRPESAVLPAGRGSARVAALWLVVTLAGLWGCSGAPAPEGEAVAHGRAAADREAWDVACAEAGLTGRWYASIGADRYEAVLAEVELCPLRVERIAEPAPLYSVAAGGGVVAVGGGHHREGIAEQMGLPAGPSRVSLFDDGQVTDIPGLGSPRGGSPSVSGDGRIALIDVSTDVGVLRVWDPHAADGAVLDTVGEPYHPAWGPDGALAVVHARPGESAMIVVYGGDGAVRVQHDTGLAEVRLVRWWPGPWAVISPPGSGVDCCDPQPPAEQAVLMDMGSGQVVGRLPHGWQGVAWSPDGQVLVVTRGAQVGYLRPGDGDEEVTVLGRLPGGLLHDAAWVE